jgi:hypothetical protein
VSPALLMRWAQRYSAALLGLALLAALVAAASGGAWQPRWVAGPWTWAALLLGTVGWVLQGLQRVFVLCRGSDVQFAWLSVAPSLTLLVAVLGLMAAGRSDFEFALAASGVACALLGAWHMSGLRCRADWQPGQPPSLHSLLGGGLHAFAQTLVLALQPWASLQLLRWQGALPGEIGHFVFAAYVYQLFALPVSFVAPLLFARISKAAGEGRGLFVGRRLWPVLGLTGVAAVLAALLLPPLLQALWGGSYAAAGWACAWMALCGPALLLNRLGVTVLLGRGRFRAATVHALGRAVLLPLVLGACAAWGGAGRVSAAAFGWWLVELMCALVLWGLWRRGPAGPDEVKGS